MAKEPTAAFLWAGDMEAAEGWVVTAGSAGDGLGKDRGLQKEGDDLKLASSRSALLFAGQHGGATMDFGGPTWRQHRGPPHRCLLCLVWGWQLCWPRGVGCGLREG